MLIHEKSRARVGEEAAVKCDLEETGFHLMCESAGEPSTCRKSLAAEADDLSFCVSPSPPFCVWSPPALTLSVEESVNPPEGGGGSFLGFPVTWP